jgi:tRNA (guanine37-N1)-methyltransferase
MKKLTFHVVSIFPKVVENYTQESILKKAQEKSLVDFKFYDIREYSDNRHSKVDDKPYAGGPGMLMQAEPILRCVEDIKEKLGKVKVILFKPGGEKFTNITARKYAKKHTDIVLICGRYEGIDSRVEKILKPEILSVGDFVLTGGEVPAMIVIDAVSRQVPGVLGDYESLEEERGYRDEFYTRPEVLEWKGKKYRVPKVLLSGNHKEIEIWRKDGSA